MEPSPLSPSCILLRTFFNQWLKAEVKVLYLYVPEYLQEWLTVQADQVHTPRSRKNMSCSCVKLVIEAWESNRDKGGMGPKTSPVSSWPAAVRLCHLLTCWRWWWENVCVVTLGHRYMVREWPPSVFMQGDEAGPCLLWCISLLGHFLEKRKSCENLTWLVEQGAWQTPLQTKCCSRGWGNGTVGEVLDRRIWGPESGFLEPRGKAGCRSMYL